MKYALSFKKKLQLYSLHSYPLTNITYGMVLHTLDFCRHSQSFVLICDHLSPACHGL